jgi:hypothetical protein
LDDERKKAALAPLVALLLLLIRRSSKFGQLSKFGNQIRTIKEQESKLNRAYIYALARSLICKDAGLGLVVERSPADPVKSGLSGGDRLTCDTWYFLSLIGSSVPSHRATVQSSAGDLPEMEAPFRRSLGRRGGKIDRLWGLGTPGAGQDIERLARA